MYGYEDYFLNRIGHTKHIHWMVNGGKQTLYPVNGLDVAHAIELLTRDDSTAGKTYELYGPKQYSYKEIVEMCGEIIKESINTINVPTQVLKTLSTALQVYPYRILRPDEVTRLTINDQPTKGALGFEDLGMVPQYLENTILTYLRGYRTAQFYELGYDDEVAQKKAKF
jgi:NADH dehydrogenase (ubiquinone) 1 alpha subcomplex subunit 9